MAEIKVEKKNRPVWPWILGVLLLAAIVWIVADTNDSEPDNQISSTYTDEQSNSDLFGNNQNNQNESDTMNRNNSANGAAMAYVNYIEQNGEKITTDHEFSRQALNRLSRALNSMVQQHNVSLEEQQKLDELRQKADKLVQNQNSTNHADLLADAFNSAAEIIQDIQQDNFPELKQEAQDVKNAADEIKPNVVVTNQKDAVKNFFDRSAKAIESMTENGSQRGDV